MAIVKKLKLVLFRLLNNYFFSLFENERIGDDYTEPNLVFIIGAPRTGSTYLSQLITYSIGVGYFSNLHDRFYQAPYLAEKIINFFGIKAKNTNFSSKYGYIEGALSESEGGLFWRRFFPKDKEHIILDDYMQGQLKYSINRLFKESHKKTLLFKNNFNGFRLRSLSKCFPNAKYVFIKRNTLDTAISLLEARERINGDESVWWSMRPKNMIGIESLEPYQQVVEQVERINEQIQDDINDLCLDAITIDYEDIVTDPKKIINKLSHFINESILTEPKNNSVKIKLKGSDILRKKIQDYIDERI
ncbi:sulfotransferase family protein [Vibrio sp. C8]